MAAIGAESQLVGDFQGPPRRRRRARLRLPGHRTRPGTAFSSSPIPTRASRRTERIAAYSRRRREHSPAARGFPAARLGGGNRRGDGRKRRECRSAQHRRSGMGVRERRIPRLAQRRGAGREHRVPANPGGPQAAPRARFSARPIPTSRRDCPADPPNGTNGYLDPEDDMLNVRFFHMKQRFGSTRNTRSQRYVTGLQGAPWSPTARTSTMRSGNYLPAPNCVNRSSPRACRPAARPVPLCAPDAGAASAEPGVLHHHRRGTAPAASVEPG